MGSARHDRIPGNETEARRASPSTRRRTLSAPLPTAAPLVDLVLHIGSGKTGTTSIQSFLSTNREGLAELGYLFARSPGNVRHSRLSLSVLPDHLIQLAPAWHRLELTSPTEFRKDFRIKLKEEIAQAGLPRLILSDEALFGGRGESRKRLRELTDEIAHTVRIVVYLRRQDDHLASRYQQRVKVGETMRLEERVGKVDLSGLYDYHTRLRQWQRVLEPTLLVVHPFERVRFPDGSLHQDFLDAAGIEARADDLKPATLANESLDAEAVEFLRILNIFRVEREGARVGLIDNWELVRRLRAASAAEPGPTLTLPPRALDEFMARWEESNRAVARDFLGDPGGELFRTPRKSSNTTSEQVFDPARLDHYLEVLELPEEIHAPLRVLVDREAATS